jgi:hypothetical protein
VSGSRTKDDARNFAGLARADELLNTILVCNGRQSFSSSRYSDWITLKSHFDRVGGSVAKTYRPSHFQPQFHQSAVKKNKRFSDSIELIGIGHDDHHHATTVISTADSCSCDYSKRVT